jgi:hypothetical protein
MATATKQSETVETIKSVTLELTLEEARTLAVVLSRVGGDCWDSPRKHTLAVGGALAGIGIEWDSAAEGILLSNNILHFSDYLAVEG